MVLNKMVNTGNSTKMFLYIILIGRLVTKKVINNGT